MPSGVSTPFFNNSNNNMIKLSYYIASEEGMKSYTLYDYDAKGNLVREELYTGTGNKLSINEYEYDSNNNKIKFLQYDANGNLTTSLIYEYDTNGNETKESMYDAYGTLIYELGN